MSRERVQVFEVGPRDGLQNEPKRVPLIVKAEYIRGLIESGVRSIELGAFVRPDRVPQMADTDQIYRLIHAGKISKEKVQFWSLVPNVVGLDRAIASGANRIAVFTAATDAFAQKNIGMTIKQSLEQFKLVIKIGRETWGSKFHVRGYVSTALGCPFEGKVSAKKALRVIEALAKLGVDQISIGDTIGVGTPNQVSDLIRPAVQILGGERTAVHFHDTRGTALANSLRALDHGVRIVDSASGGLGGCPFAPGAAGNLATEDLVYMLHGMGMQTGINLELLSRASYRLLKKMNRPVRSKYLQTFISRCSKS